MAFVLVGIAIHILIIISTIIAFEIWRQNLYYLFPIALLQKRWFKYTCFSIFHRRKQEFSKGYLLPPNAFLSDNCLIIVIFIMRI